MNITNIIFFLFFQKEIFDGYCLYYLVDKKVPFKEAHTIVGRLVRYSIDNEIEIKKLPKDKLKQFSNKFVKHEIVKLFDPKVSVKSKKSIKRSGK